MDRPPASTGLPRWEGPCQALGSRSSPKFLAGCDQLWLAYYTYLEPEAFFRVTQYLVHHFGLPVVEREEVMSRTPIRVNFENPSFTVSGASLIDTVTKESY